ncbi:hypothetical protein [Brucella gallinifaecis]|uniref:hypothetical protein n=1 Tax=Brucella gallinifaecis TaxID=215590 RepID=UPI00235DE326|nr:hypothetical protein [Brucella gallinifaecis]
MNRIIFIIIVSTVATVIGGMIANFENGNYAFWQKDDPFASMINELKSVNQLSHNIAIDHEDDIRTVYYDNINNIDERVKNIGNKINGYFLSSMKSASDESLIKYMEANKILYSSFLKHNPKYCLEFTKGALPPEAFQNREISNNYNYLIDKANLVYVSSKNGKAHPKLPDGEMEALINYTGITDKDKQLLISPENYDYDSICTTYLKLFSTDHLPDNTRAKYVRAYFQ